MCHPASPINQGILYLEKDNNVSRETLLRNESYNIGVYINIDEVNLTCKAGLWFSRRPASIIPVFDYANDSRRSVTLNKSPSIST